MKKELSYYISLFQDNERYAFIEDIKLQKILYLFSGYISYIYFENIKDSSLEEELKEMKAHSIFVYFGSIIEAICYDFVKKNLTDEKSKRKYLEIQEFKKLQKIEKAEDLYICELHHKAIDLNDSINFHALIHGMKDRKLIDKKILWKIDSFRKMRNIVHINAFMDVSEQKLIKKLEQAFIDAKEIFDYFENQ
jgi:hypothetical protein